MTDRQPRSDVSLEVKPHAYDPIAQPELFEGVLTRRVLAFIVDVFSPMVVGWQLSNSLRSSLAIDALEMAIWNRTRDGGDLIGLVQHTDRGSQTELNRWSQHPLQYNF